MSEVQPPKFLVDDNGHLKKRNKKKAARNRKTGLEKGSFIDPRYCGTNGFSFTPVGYNSFSCRPTKVMTGCRPGLDKTNNEAHQYLNKFHNTYTKRNKTIRKTYRDKYKESNSFEVSEPKEYQ
mmetsp:Transcript_12263/g.18316  ORF Transcript_12263/g.18316 Transcript_12263/m.18316 type:complete len:123 (+) Transcript_12263:39-407(+)